MNCCEKCAWIYYERDEYDRGVNLTHKCYTNKCECHTPPSIPNWEENLYTLVHDECECLKGDIDKCVWEEIKALIHSLLKEQREELAVLVEGMREEFERLAHNNVHKSANWGIESTYRVVHLDSALKALSDVVEAIRNKGI